MKLYNLEHLLREYITEVRPDLSDQLQLSLALKAIEKCREGLLSEFINFLIKRKQNESQTNPNGHNSQARADAERAGFADFKRRAETGSGAAKEGEG